MGLFLKVATRPDPSRPQWGDKNTTHTTDQPYMIVPAEVHTDTNTTLQESYTAEYR